MDKNCKGCFTKEKYNTTRIAGLSRLDAQGHMLLEVIWPDESVANLYSASSNTMCTFCTTLVTKATVQRVIGAVERTILNNNVFSEIGIFPAGKEPVIAGRQTVIALILLKMGVLQYGKSCRLLQ